MIDLRGQRFGRLTVSQIKVRGVRHGGQKVSTRWYCICDCGGGRLATTSMLRSGGVTQCRDCAKPNQRGGRRPKHGYANHPLYFLWRTMIRRCHAPNHPDYRNYGGKGVTVCEQWRESFEAFLADVGERPPDPPEWEGKRAYWTLDRIDPFGDYEPSNVRWASWSTQNRNTRRAAAERQRAAQEGSGEPGLPSGA